jgi:hypothetical protein
MLVLRVGRKARWEGDLPADDPGRISQATLDLQLGPDEAGLSVFRVEGEDETVEVAVRFALTCRERPAHVDFVVFPAELATVLGLTVALVPIEGLDPALNARHHEIIGLTPELSSRLAASILATPERRVGRVRDRDLVALGAELCGRDPELRNYLRGEWAAKLTPLPGNPPPEG